MVNPFTSVPLPLIELDMVYLGMNHRSDLETIDMLLVASADMNEELNERECNVASRPSPTVQICASLDAQRANTNDILGLLLIMR